MNFRILQCYVFLESFHWTLTGVPPWKEAVFSVNVDYFNADYKLFIFISLSHFITYIR